VTQFPVLGSQSKIRTVYVPPYRSLQHLPFTYRSYNKLTLPTVHKVEETSLDGTSVCVEMSPMGDWCSATENSQLGTENEELGTEN